MAAAGYAAALGATNAQMLCAAELALAPHLGQTCDPEGGRENEDYCEQRKLSFDHKLMISVASAIIVSSSGRAS